MNTQRERVGSASGRVHRDPGLRELREALERQAAPLLLRRIKEQEHRPEGVVSVVAGRVAGVLIGEV